MEPFRRINPQDLLFAQQLRDVNRRLDEATFPFGVDEEFLAVHSSVPPATVRNLFRIIASDGLGRYSAVPVSHVVADVPSSGPRGVDIFTNDITGFNGPVLDHLSNPLTEINRIGTVAIGTIVVAFSSSTSESWEFDARGSSGVTKVGVASVIPDALGRIKVSYHLVLAPASATLPSGSYSITGRVTRDGATAAAGVRLFTSDSRFAITDSNGDYSITSIPAQALRLMVESIDNDTVLPVSREITLPGSVTGQDFDITTVP